MCKTLAIFSPSQNAYSETFIQAHKKLPFNIKFYYDGYLPTKLEGSKNIFQFSWKQKIEKQLHKNFTSREYALINSLKAESVDVILVEYGPTACATLNVAQYLKIPMIVHFHGYDASMYAIIAKYGAQYKKVFAYSSFVIAVSNKMKDALILLGCPEEKIVIAVYGPDPVFFNVNPLYSSQQFVAVGRFVEKKAPQLTIAAFKKVVAEYPAAQLVMVGDGALLEVCKQEVGTLGLQGNVVFKGVQTAEEIQRLFRKSLAFVQHSIIATDGDAEGTPVAILEAQAAALPVISTDHAGIADVVVHSITGLLVAENDVSGMANNMIALLREDGLAAQLGRQGRMRIREYYQLEQNLSVLESLIAGSLQSSLKS